MKTKALHKRLLAYLGLEPIDGQASETQSEGPPPKNPQNPPANPGGNLPMKTQGATTLPPRQAPPQTTIIRDPVDTGNRATPVQQPNDVMRGKAQILDNETEKKFRNFAGLVLSSPELDNGLSFSDVEREHCVYLDTGEFLIEKNEPSSPFVWSAQGKLKARGLPIGTVWHANGSVIRTLYENQARKTPKDPNAEMTYNLGGVTNTMTEQQKLLLLVAKNADAAGANDIRVLVGDKEAKVWFRISGALQFIREYPAAEMRSAFQAIYSILEGVSGTSFKDDEITPGIILKKHLTQISDRLEGLRFMFIPAGDNHILLSIRMVTDQKETDVDIDSLGYSKTHLKQFQKLRSMPWGVFYISGPTGSGKSTTLKVNLESLAIETGGEASILTAEDPREYQMSDLIVQLSMKSTSDPQQRAKNYTNMIMAILRADPDIICVGEVREEETSNLVFNSGESGHPTWTTAHCNSAISVFSRLRGMGGKDYHVFNETLVIGSIAQRLVRTVCPHCCLTYAEIKASLDENQRERYERIFSGDGENLDKLRFRNVRNPCDPATAAKENRRCVKGSASRTIIAEILMTDETIMALAKENKNVEMANYAKTTLEFVTMDEHGWYKAASGLCDPGDIESVAGLMDSIDITRRSTIRMKCE